MTVSKGQRGRPKKQTEEVKTNCFAYGDNGCSALSELVCATKKCPFFKTREQHKAELEKNKY